MDDNHIVIIFIGIVIIFSIFFMTQLVIRNISHKNQNIIISLSYSDMIFIPDSGMYCDAIYNNNQLKVIVNIRCLNVFIFYSIRLIINCLEFSRTYLVVINKFYSFLLKICQKYSISVLINCLLVRQMCLVCFDLGNYVLRFSSPIML